jgi:hypothetical protein
MLTRTAAAFTVFLALSPAAASAQTAAAPPRVELEVYGGLSRFLDAGVTTVTPPAAGAPIGTSSPMFPSRRVSTWWFGDGAELLNAAAAELGLTARLTPLDTTIGTIGRGAESRGAFGGRLRMRTAPRVWIEAGVDVTATSADVADSVQAAAETARASFVSTFSELLASGPFANRSVTATAATEGGAWRDVTSSLAANIELAPAAGLTPHLTLGGAWVWRTGTAASLRLTGRYAARILTPTGPPIDETDAVVIRSDAGAGPGLVVGAGVSRAAGRVSLRLDARLIAANRTISANVDASPSVASGTPADFIESFTNPSIQFSNNATTGRRSTLSGDPFDALAMARSTRLQVRALITVGAALRF